MSAPVRFHAGLADLMADTDSIRPHPRNPRNGDVDAIAESLLAFGCYRPIVIQASTRQILAGHHLYYALMELGVSSVPVLPVDLSDEDALRILVADNRTSDLGRYDEGLQGLLLKELSDLDLLRGTGWDTDQVVRLLAFTEPPPMAEQVAEDWVTITVTVTSTAADAFAEMTEGKNAGARLMHLMRQAGWSG